MYSPARAGKTGNLEREQQPLWKKLKLILLFNPVTQWIDTTHMMRLHIHDKSVSKGKQALGAIGHGARALTPRQGKEEGTPSSHHQIKGFVDSYGIDMGEYDPSDLKEYTTFEDFFARRHRHGARPIFKDDDDSHAVTVADSRVVVYDTVDETKRLWIKGRDFTMAQLVMDLQLGQRLSNAAVASFRLSPQDYHRYHSPVSGTVKQYRGMPGDYYQVDPVALQSKVDILTRNRREYVVLETKEFGDVLFVAIGATDVGTVRYGIAVQHRPRMFTWGCASKH